jgi:death-on-curing family protein
MRPRQINIADVEYVAFRLAQKLYRYNEPIPSFGTRFPNRLESCLASPFQKFNKKYLYKGLIKKAAILFYLMIKNHPFQNGNKRIAITTLFVFLYDNKRWLEATQDELYEFAVMVASSPADKKNIVIEVIESFIKNKYTVY